MAVIEYTAADRADLVTGHTVGTNYKIEVKLIAFDEAIDTPKTIHVALNGSVETVLKRATMMYSATISWPSTDDENIREFLFSIAGGEMFNFDPYGTIATPDVTLEVVSVTQSQSLMRIQRRQASTRRTSLMMRPAVNRL